VIADPGDPPEDAVGLLKFLRYRVMRQGGHSGAWRSLLRRAGSQPVADEGVVRRLPAAETRRVGVNGRANAVADSRLRGPVRPIDCTWSSKPTS
jgi:hypothetical protein